MWYLRFVRWLHKEPHKRTLLGTYREEDEGARADQKRAPPAWSKNRDRWKWEERALAFDLYKNEKRHREKQAHVAKVADAALVWVEEALAHGPSKREVAEVDPETGAVVRVEVHPASFHVGHVAQLAKVAVDLAAWGLGVPKGTTRAELAGDRGGPVRLSLADAAGLAGSLLGDDPQGDGGEEDEETTEPPAAPWDAGAEAAAEETEPNPQDEDPDPQDQGNPGE